MQVPADLPISLPPRRPGGSGGKAPHLNLLQPDAPGSPTLRAYSPCTHGAGAAASPRAGARSPACCGVLRSAGHVSYSSD